MTPSDIISDAEIQRVHGNANFGDQDKREVVNEAIRKAAQGFHNGFTAGQIILKHELVKRSGGQRKISLTPKGRKYLCAIAATS